MRRLIFSIYIDIPEAKLDNPASWNNKTGKQKQSNKSKNTKEKLALYYFRLKTVQKKYAGLCGADYILHEDQQEYNKFASWFRDNAPQISEYDIINFYKHYLMYMHSFVYDEVCYLDFDVVPMTEEKNLFEEFDMFKFHVGESNEESMWGRNVAVEHYNLCIRNPASKWFNAQAMAFEEELEPLEDVFNTGIMFSRSSTIQGLNYFKDFTENLEMMEELKSDKFSMYPHNIQRSFNYDNETLFSHRINKSNIKYETLPIEWNTVDVSSEALENAHLIHVISKDFHLIL
jgi:hypothetical protein